MSNHQNFRDSHNATSLQVSEDGQEPCSLRGGVQTDLFGREALPANHSQQQGKEREKMTSDTSGLSSLISSESANLQQSLVNKLQQLSDMDGSMIYKTTLKRKVTPAGQSYYHLAASARITKGTDYSSWPTPSTRDHKGGYKGGRIRNGKISTDTLDVAAQLTPWATPTATDPKRGTKPPRPQDTGIPLTQQVSGLTHKPSIAETESTVPSQLNPRFSLWLMGYPIEWACSGERVTPLSRKRQRKS